MLQPHEERVVIEKKELDTNMDKLLEFLRSDKSKSVHPEELARLNRQLNIMTHYSNILSERIKFFYAQPS